MNLKKLFSTGIIPCLLVCGLDSCQEKDPPPGNSPKLEGITLKQTANGKESVVLSEISEEIIFTSELKMNNNNVWSKPVFEQSFSDIFQISKDNISVTDSEGKSVNSARLEIKTPNELVVTFNLLSDSYYYLKNRTFTISIKTTVKNDVTETEWNNFVKTGYEGKSFFYDADKTENVASNVVKVSSDSKYSSFLYNVKGDPRNSEYAGKLNVVYFIPSDMQANPDYRRRLSTVLLKHQLFLMKWMKRWGYEEKSFGLPLAENGMVEITTITGQGRKADYPYDSSVSANKIITEIKNYFAAHQITTYNNNHTLVITAINEDLVNGVPVSSTPFYGYGKWCFALDYPGMSFESLAINPITGEEMAGKTNASHVATVWIGGMLHELGHGLNMPHVGPGNSQKNDVNYGIPLMGSGNRTYGETPTFLHESSAAVLNNCELSTFTPKTFYDATTANVKISTPTVKNSICTVRGAFTASKSVTDVVVRCYNSTETFLGGSTGYTSVAFVVKPESDNSFEVEFPIPELLVNTFNYRIGATILMGNGNKASFTLPYVYTVAKEGNDYTLDMDGVIANDGSWSVTASQNPLHTGADVSNSPGSLVDGDLSTSLSLVKPDKNYEGVTVGASEKVFFTIDFSKQISFDGFWIINRNFQKYLNPKAVSFYGSHNGSDFEAIKTSVVLENDSENIISLGRTVAYRYLRMYYDDWDKTMGSTMQVAEFMLTKE